MQNCWNGSEPKRGKKDVPLVKNDSSIYVDTHALKPWISEIHGDFKHAPYPYITFEALCIYDLISYFEPSQKCWPSNSSSFNGKSTHHESSFENRIIILSNEYSNLKPDPYPVPSDLNLISIVSPEEINWWGRVFPQYLTCWWRTDCKKGIMNMHDISVM